MNLRSLTLILAVMGGFLTLGVWNIFRAAPIDATTAREAQDRLDGIPLTIGPWVGKVLPGDPLVMKAAEAVAYSSRSYNHPNGETVNVLLLFGETGAQGAHDPSVCYRGYGYRRVQTPVRHSVPNSLQTTLWTARFVRSDPAPATTLEIFWGWGHEEGWTAPENPRFELAGRKLIYKIYVQRPVRQGTQPPMDEFLAPFFEQLARAIAGPSKI